MTTKKSVVDRVLGIHPLRLEPLKYKGQDTGRRVVVDKDDHIYGIVSAGYKPISHQAVVAQVQEFLPGAKITNAYLSGCGREFSRVVLNFKLTDVFELNGDSPVHTYVNVRNSLDGSWPLGIVVSPVRVVCQNTFILHRHEALLENTYKHHNRGLGEFKVGLPLLSYVQQAMQGEVAIAKKLIHLPCTTAKGKAFFIKLYERRLIGKRQMEAWTETIMSPTQADQEPKNYWNLYNVVTNDLSRKLEEEDGASRPLSEIAIVGEQFAALVR